ncbi:hypothetical protein D3C81_581310 [compost metagenome]
MSGASSASAWPSGSLDEHCARARLDQARGALAAVARPAVLSQLWPDQHLHRRAQRRRQPGVCLGRQHPAVALDHHPVLVDRPALRPVVPAAAEPSGDGPPCPAPAQRAGHLHPRFSALAAAFHRRTASAGWPVRLVVRCADGLRQTVQPGAVAAHRLAGDHLGDVCPAYPRQAATLAGTWLDGADRPVGADHLATPLYRPAQRRAGGGAVRLAVAG